MDLSSIRLLLSHNIAIEERPFLVVQRAKGEMNCFKNAMTSHFLSIFPENYKKIENKIK